VELTLPALALVRRELMVTLRRGRSWVFLALFIGAATGAVMLAWPARAVAVIRAGQVSRELMETIVWVLRAACFCLVPGLAGAAIIGEQETDTYEALHLTLIRPAGIALGKMVNTAGFFLLMTLAAMPVVGALFYLPGFDGIELAADFAGLAALAFYCAGIGVAVSSRGRKSTDAISGSYMLAGLLLFFAMMSEALLQELFGDALTRSPGWTGAFWKHVSAQFGFSLAAIGLIAWLIAALLLRRLPAAAKKTPPRQFGFLASLKAGRLTAPRKKIFPPIPDGRNPMLTRELRFGWQGFSPSALSLGLTSFAMFLLFNLLVGLPLYNQGLASDNSPLMIFIILHLVLIVFVAHASLPGMLCKEVEQDNLDLLRLCLLTPREVLAGKYLAGAVQAGSMVAASFLASAPLQLILDPRPRSALALLMIYATMIICTALALGSGILASALVPRTVQAVAVTFGIGPLIFFGMPLLAVFMIGFLSWPHSLPEEALWFFSPLFPVAAGFYTSLLNPTPPLLLSWLINAAIFAGLAFALFHFAGRLWERRLARESGDAA
jgi:hypothetical protein